MQTLKEQEQENSDCCDFTLIVAVSNFTEDKIPKTSILYFCPICLASDFSVLRGHFTLKDFAIMNGTTLRRGVDLGKFSHKYANDCLSILDAMESE